MLSSERPQDNPERQEARRSILLTEDERHALLLAVSEQLRECRVALEGLDAGSSETQVRADYDALANMVRCLDNLNDRLR